MIKLIDKIGYRNDIDGLRAIAVIAVLIFHLGHLPNGYLGVDIFFVISGYLITKILYLQAIGSNLRIKNFYLKRIRRIIPLVSFFTLISLPIGFLLMLPDDFENLAQSVVATNLFSNNILQYLTTGNYWDVVNEFKPLMHTWSLAVEEQYYFIYPFLFFFLKGKNLKYLGHVLILLTIFSLALYFSQIKEAAKFYLLPARFFELSIGGLGAVFLKNKLIVSNYRLLIVLAISVLLVFNVPFLMDFLYIPVVVVLTLILLTTYSEKKGLTSLLLENSVMVFIGKISFSIYMWHQLILAFSRYALFQEMNIQRVLLLFLLTIFLSYLTYKFIEQPFRKKDKFSTKAVLIILLVANLISTVGAFYVYKKGGVLKDFPHLEIFNGDSKNLSHSAYNDRIYAKDKDFPNNEKINVLVIGNSFARDWANVLLESNYGEKINLSYYFTIRSINDKIKDRVAKADLVFWSTLEMNSLKKLNLPKSDLDKVWCTGTKNFGINSGLFYNYSGKDFCAQRTHLEDGYWESNEQLKKEWGAKYIDLIAPVIDSTGEMPVFTDDCKFISQDCRHFTKGGAVFYSKMLSQKLDLIFEN